MLIEKIKKFKLKKQAAVCGAALFPILHFYLLEAYTHNGWMEVRHWPQAFNILLFEITAWLLCFLFRNIKWALRVQGACAMVIGLANYYVYTFRSLPLAPWDIFSVGTALSVAEHYDFMPTPRVAVVLAGFILTLCLEGFLELDFKKWKWYASLTAALVCGVVLGAVGNVLQQEDFQNRHGMYNKLFTPVFMWQVNGFALTMVMELPYLSIEKPDGYDKEEAKELLASYASSEESENAKSGVDLDGLPNILVVMNEAFSDLGVLGEFQASKDYMPYFHSLLAGAKNTRSGYLHVSVCGGNTANTEFEFLTGNTMAFLPQGSIPYQQYINSAIPALPSYLQELGYETYAMHPFRAEGWERDQIYPLLGFEHMYFINDYNNKEYIRTFVSDQSCVDKLIETYEQKESGRPMFAFQVTMQNHGSYSDVYENFTPDITVEGVSSDSVSTYLSLIKKSDEALESLIAYFSNAKEPVMVVFFGDHQPNDAVAAPILQLNGIDYRTLTEEQTKLRYQVPYLIWTNYDMEPSAKNDLSVNYLANEVLEAAGIELPPYQKFLKELSNRYPVISAAQNDAAVEGVADLERYKKLQYYQLFDIQD